MRRTLSDALSSKSRICESINLKSSDQRVIDIINLAQERLLSEGHWWNTIAKYSISVTNQLFSLPPQFATIEQIAVCSEPINLRNNWYEFNPGGPWVFNDPTAAQPNVCSGNQALFRGTFPTAKDIVSGNKIYAQCDVADDVGATILVLGIDSAGNRVRTKVLGVWQDGETIALSQTPGTLSSTTWSKITDIQKPVTNGQCWIVQASSPTVIISTMEYFETRPSLPRYLLPTTFNVATQIDLIGKLAFIPVVNPTDYLIIGNLPALKLACQAIKYEEEQMMGQATLYMYGGIDPKTKIKVTGAVQCLQSELAHYRGSGEVASIQVTGSYPGGGEPVEQLM